MTRHIVIIEDDLAILDTLRDLLDSEGYTVVGVTHPDQLGAATDDIEPELFIIDLMLPKLSGIEVAEQLQADGFADTPMVAMSASGLMLKVAQTSRLFRGMLTKPFDVAMLLALIDRLLA